MSLGEYPLAHPIPDCHVLLVQDPPAPVRGRRKELEQGYLFVILVDTINCDVGVHAHPTQGCCVIGVIVYNPSRMRIVGEMIAKVVDGIEESPCTSKSIIVDAECGCLVQECVELGGRDDLIGNSDPSCRRSRHAPW